MRKGFYARLAADNLKKNSKVYLPYLVTCVLMVAMFYIITALSLNADIQNLPGSAPVQTMLDFGSKIVAIFAFIFLFYTNSFLMKRRKKEFGLFNILGMEKRHISRLLAFETLYIALIAWIGGFLVGIAFDKLLYLLIVRILDTEIALGFYISVSAIVRTLVLFAIVFCCIFLNGMRQIHLSNPIELLKSGQVGEREPKTKGLLAVLGVLCLGIGYAIAVAVQAPVQVVSYIFIAVILVIAGTYFLFTAGSIAFLKMLRKNKRYYYQTRHFTAVSGMLYRMKQNAVGLANICVLSTMVLVMLSTTSSLLIGITDLVQTRYPYDCAIYAGEDIQTEIEAQLASLEKKQPVSINDRTSYSYLSFYAVQDGNQFQLLKPNSLANGAYLDLVCIPLEDYNRNYGTNETLQDGEVLLSVHNGHYDFSSIQVFDQTYSVKKQVSNFLPKGTAASDPAGIATIQMVVRDPELLHQLDVQPKKQYGKGGTFREFGTFYGMSLSGDDKSQQAFCDALKEQLLVQDPNLQMDCRVERHSNVIQLYGGLFFLGAFLGTLFVIATVLMIYYKQISEGYEDAERFTIMQKVGMSLSEVKQSIHTQVLLVFFLPLLMTGVHLIFAFPIFKRLLAMMYLTNVKLYILCTICCFIAFALLYTAVYLLTARVYDQIVSKKKLH